MERQTKPATKNRKAGGLYYLTLSLLHSSHLDSMAQAEHLEIQNPKCKGDSKMAASGRKQKASLL
jgi:hypothetical protein